MKAGHSGRDALWTRSGHVPAVRFGDLLAGLGLGATLLLKSPVSTVIGLAWVGRGLTPVTPLVFSTAGVSSRTAITAVATMRYISCLAGAPLIGLLTMQSALGVLAILVLIVAVLCGNVESAALPKDKTPIPKSMP